MGYHRGRRPTGRTATASDRQKAESGRAWSDSSHERACFRQATSVLAVLTCQNAFSPASRSHGVGKAREYKATCSTAYCGATPPELAQAPEVVTLVDHAGIRGLSIICPEQPYDAAARRTALPGRCGKRRPGASCRWTSVVSAA